MGELKCDWSPMVTVTGTTILLTEFLVERRIDPPLVQAFERGPACGPNADVRHGVAPNASIGRDAAKGRMADEAIARELGMCRHEGARAHHRAGIDEGEHDKSNQVGHDDDPEPGPLHGRLQNRRTAMRCATARTPNARVIGK